MVHFPAFDVNRWDLLILYDNLCRVCDNIVFVESFDNERQYYSFIEVIKIHSSNFLLYIIAYTFQVRSTRNMSWCQFLINNAPADTII